MRATFCLMPVLLAAAAASVAYDPERIAWSRLEFKASKFFLTARSEVELAGRPAAEAIADLLFPNEDTGLAPRGPKSYRIDIRTRLLSRDSRVRHWFDPGNARALQRVSHDVSKKRLRHRTYRYTSGGVFSRTLRPGEGEEDKPYAGWSRVQDQQFPFSDTGGPPVSEPAALLYLIPAGDFRVPGDKDRLRVFTRRQVREVDVKVVEKERIDVDYVEVSGGRERTVDARVEALRVAVRPIVGEGEDADDFKLLGLEGAIDIYLDPKTRVPLLVRGKIDIAGTVRLRLKRAELK